MYRAQQLSEIARRVRLTSGDRAAGADRLPDPAFGPVGRELLHQVAEERHPTLSAAVGEHPAPLVSIERSGAGGAVRIELRLAPGERLYGAADADAAGLDRRGDHVHLVTELHRRGRHRMVEHTCDLCRSAPVRRQRGDGLSIGVADAPAPAPSPSDAPTDIAAASRIASHYGELIVPFVISSNGWAVYVSSAWHDAVLDLGERDPDRIVYTAPGGEADVVVFGPGDPASLLREFTRLTGRQPLPPAWTLGVLQSRFGYESFDHVHGVLDRYEQERLPVHGVVFDVHWLRDHVDLHWDPEHFPDPAGNLARIAERGVRSIVITEPGTKSTAANHASGAARRAFATDAAGAEFDSDQWYARRGIRRYRPIEPSSAALVNVFREDAGDWWYEQHAALRDQGVDAWWLDLNEPEEVTAEVRFPDTDWPARRDEIRGEEARALFAIAQQRLFARRDEARGHRRFVLSRAASAGSQRYGASPWTGDVGATWEDLAIQPRLVLTAGMCGLPLAGSDVGGFSGDPGPELFARWVQMGTVLPIFRAHGYMADREPWSQGPAALDACRPSLVLRAQLLPSIVTWARRALLAGEPLARPMLLGPLGTPDAAAYAADERWHDRHDQWFFGPLLVAPVLEPGATVRTVQLPPGLWVDVWSGTHHVGGGALEVEVRDSTLPLFVRPDELLLADADPLAGRGRSWPPPELLAWSFAGPSGTATGQVYLDDGASRDHERGVCCTIDVTASGSGLETVCSGGSFPASRVTLAAPMPGTV